MAALTAKFLESVKGAPGRRLEWADDGQRGLYFRCTPQGEKSWSVRYRLKDGSQRRLTIGLFPQMKLADARLRAMKELAKVGDGRDPAAEVRTERRNARAGRTTRPQTFADLWERYERATVAGKRPSTAAYQAWLYARHIAPRMGTVKLAELDRATIRGVIREIGDGAPVTGNRAQSLITATLNWGVEEEWTSANPISQMSRLFAEVSRERVMQDSELKALWTAIEAAGTRDDLDVSPRMALALKLALLTLTRGNDVAGLHSSEIDPVSRTWTIPSERHKSKRAHVVPLSASAWAIILDLFGNDPAKWTGHAFPNARRPEEPMKRASLTRGMRRIVQAFDLADCTPHDFRRTGATLIASERIGAAPHIVTALLGHTPEGPAVTQIYNRHRYVAEKRRALESWEALLNEIVSGERRASNVVELRAAQDTE
jgi:integrase